METGLEPMFDYIKECIEDQLKNYESDQDSSVQNSLGGGSASFRIKLDGKGNGSYELSKIGFGKTVHAKAKATSPAEGVFNIHLTSTGGTNVSKTEIKTGESISCDIKTKSMGKTTVKLTVHSSIPNTTFVGRLDYTL